MTDEIYMQRALELAQIGIGQVSPNPRVGCVIVHQNQIIGEGWHHQYGMPHAEVNALTAVKDESLLPESSLYVNLEPCSHQGKTPPCADLLIRKKIGRVVIANLDTNPLVSGEGIKRLRQAGVEVITGVLAVEGRELNKRFFTWIEKRRPFVLLKWAETADGFMARENFESKWISSDYSRQLVHRWRSEEDAILVGSTTAKLDNPALNVRNWSGRNPVRVVLDRFLRLDERLKVFDRTQPTLCYNLLRHDEQTNLIRVRVDERDFLQQVMHDLFKRNIQSIMVEGGSQTLQQFIDAGLWDEACIFRSTQSFGKGIPAPNLHGKRLPEIPCGEDRLVRILPD
ncbi:MAG TPA: bifunctional diaminohydroxyphosphoribosylaminopyrimidine deaminase/5-amino-6-(5-phosphoribosylamino)uracil reductase RibD [Cyclobacteriaceae bacterium]|nr:bifunctional diaminohydroxyphosphoribosylaminopyrimidine deaminase/5-amino-6-(5-phosphoribosylamino)uracil reductase RibD [Cyclobacteriaceae bacterium]